MKRKSYDMMSIYLTMLSVTLTTHRQTIEQMSNKKAVIPNLRYSQEFAYTEENHGSHYSRLPGSRFEPETSEYKAGVLTTQPQLAKDFMLSINASVNIYFSENGCLLRCSAVYSSRNFPFQRSLLPPPSA
jgi:hypothetical protein